MSNEVENELKPCPFCGDTAELYYGVDGSAWKIECNGCWTTMIDGLSEGEEALINNWNTRASE